MNCRSHGPTVSHAQIHADAVALAASLNTVRPILLAVAGGPDPDKERDKDKKARKRRAEEEALAPAALAQKIFNVFKNAARELLEVGPRESDRSFF